MEWQLPNRNLAGDYRFAYQGQEKDPESGKEAFKLRLWDGRIGRWLSPDPKGEFISPYLGMGNNPVSKVDPDGGSTEGPCPPDCGGELASNNGLSIPITQAHLPLPVETVSSVTSVGLVPLQGGAILRESLPESNPFSY